MLDLVCFGFIRLDTIAIAPSFPEINSGAEVAAATQAIGGDAAIVACHASGLGLRVGLIGNSIGNDSNGQLLLGMMDRYNIHQELCQIDSSTPSNFVAVDRRGNRTWFGLHCKRVRDDCFNTPLELFTCAKLVYIDGYLGNASVRAVRFASNSQVPILLNMGTDDLASRSSISITSYYDKSCPPMDLARHRAELADILAIVTLGDKGSIFAGRERVLVSRAHNISVVDASGAGAAFAAAIAYSFLRNHELEEMARFAAALAALHCSVLGGAGDFSAQDVMHYMEKSSNHLRFVRDPYGKNTGSIQ